MPLVVLTRDRKAVPDEEVPELAESLQRIVAEALSGSEPESTLTPDDIAIEVRVPGPLDRGFKPLQVVVFAHKYSSRAENLEERAEKIARELRGHPCVPESVIDDKGGFVWIFLGTTGFSEL